MGLLQEKSKQVNRSMKEEIMMYIIFFVVGLFFITVIITGLIKINDDIQCKDHGTDGLLNTNIFVESNIEKGWLECYVNTIEDHKIIKRPVMVYVG